MFAALILSALLGSCSGDYELLTMLVTDASLAANPEYPNTSHGMAILRISSTHILDYRNYTHLVTFTDLTEVDAEELCERAGHGPLKSWSSEGEAADEYRVLNGIAIDFYIDYADFKHCWYIAKILPPGCKYQPRGTPGVVLECRPRHDSWGDVRVLASTSGSRPREDSTGSLVVEWAGGQRGTVCSNPQGNDTLTAELMCRAAGYPGVKSVGTHYTAVHERKERLDCNEEDEDTFPVVEEVSCPSDAIDLSECTASELSSSSSCDIDSTLVVECEQRWVVTSVGLYRNPGGGHDESGVVSGGNKGTVVVDLLDRVKGGTLTGVPVRWVETGKKFPNYTHALCKALGYDLSKRWKRNGDDSVSYANIDDRLSCGYMRYKARTPMLHRRWGGFVGLECEQGNLESCKVRMVDDGANIVENALWLWCK